SWDGTMRLWEAGTGKLLVVLNDGLTEDIEGIAFSPDGAAVAVGAVATVNTEELRRASSGAHGSALSGALSSPGLSRPGA
ncbi:MAG: hypothetical protein ABGY41_05620, partial [Candidatus Poribacteria bacterium]